MQQNELIELASQLFQGKLDQDGDGIDIGDIQAALGNLLSDDNGNLDIQSLISNMNFGSLMDIASSWLGDGENQSISANQISDILGSEKLSAFAEQLGISEENASNGLSEALPSLVDKSSSGGALLDSVGGLDGVMSLAGKLFGR